MKHNKHDAEQALADEQAFRANRKADPEALPADPGGHGARKEGPGANRRIYVNGRGMIEGRERLRHEDVAGLWTGRPRRKGEQFSLTYSNGPKGRPEGMILKEDEVEVVDGMKFNVVATDLS